MIDIVLSELESLFNNLPYVIFVMLLVSIIGSIVFKKV